MTADRVRYPAESERVAYLVSRYPGLSHSFIEREIEGLRRLGVAVDTFSIRGAPSEELLTPLMEEEARRTMVLLQDRRRLAASSWSLLRTRPRAYSRVLRLALCSGPAQARSRLWQMFYLAEAVLLREELVRRGIRHLHVHFANNGADVARLVVALGEAIDGSDAGWVWTFSMHGPTELENVAAFDLAAKVDDAAAVACISDFTKSQLMRMLPPDKWPKLSVVRMGIDTDKFAPHREDRREADDGIVQILYVGRLVAEKGAPLLVSAVHELVKAGRDVRLNMVGAGKLDTAIASQIEQRGLSDHVHLLGPKGQDDLPELYQAADVFCLPSFQEGLPVVLMEAMASGCPVVTTRIAGIPELVDDTNGRVVAPGRVDSLVSALAELADDSDLRRDLGRAGRVRVQEQHDRAVVAAQQAAFLRRYTV